MRDIGIVGYPGVNAMDLSGPLQVFGEASVLAETRSERGYRVHVLGPASDSFTSDAGLTICPSACWDNAPPLDTIVVPGGAALREAALQSRVAKWVASRASSTRRITSVCTGIYGLAATGLLDGRTATTHWRFLRDVQRAFPRVSMKPDRIFVRDGRFITSGGVCAGIDLALALVEEDLGRSLSLRVAREMVVHAIRPGGQSQYSELMRAQERAPKRLADLIAWIAAHLDNDLSVAALAQRAAISERQLARLFREGLGESPASFVERMRLSAAREALENGGSVEEVARIVGYASSDSFRRAFGKIEGVSPAMYRRDGAEASVRNRRIDGMADLTPAP